MFDSESSAKVGIILICVACNKCVTRHNRKTGALNSNMT